MTNEEREDLEGWFGPYEMRDLLDMFLEEVDELLGSQMKITLAETSHAAATWTALVGAKGRAQVADARREVIKDRVLTVAMHSPAAYFCEWWASISAEWEFFDRAQEAENEDWAWDVLKRAQAVAAGLGEGAKTQSLTPALIQTFGGCSVGMTTTGM